MARMTFANPNYGFPYYGAEPDNSFKLSILSGDEFSQKLKLYAKQLHDITPRRFCDMRMHSVNLNANAELGEPFGCHAGFACEVFNCADLASCHNLDPTTITNNQAFTSQIGAHSLAEFLGFDSYFHLLNWAHSNSVVWGNRYGAGMFNRRGKAFGQDASVFDAEILADHWSGVADRFAEKSKIGEMYLCL